MTLKGICIFLKEISALLVKVILFSGSKTRETEICAFVTITAAMMVLRECLVAIPISAR